MKIKCFVYSYLCYFQVATNTFIIQDEFRDITVVRLIHSFCHYTYMYLIIKKILIVQIILFH